jgi:hypothetical protein
MAVSRSFGVSAAGQETIAIINHNRTADVAIVNTRLVADDDATLSETTERVWISPDNGLYRLDLEVPDAELRKGAPWTLHVLLPPTAEHRSQPDEVQKPDTPGGRTVLIWRGEADPLLSAIWAYRP